MKKWTLVIMTICLLTLCAFAMVACGGDSEENGGNSPKTITGITFEDETVLYDGNVHTITIDGTLPQGATVEYTNNSGTNVGTYNATAVISADGYNTLTLNATLTISKPDITGITFEDETVLYDGNVHTITIDGTLPQGATVEYTNNSGTNAGTYNATAVISADGYNTLTLNATLTIDKATISGVSFVDLTVDYNASEHELTATGIPEEATVTYTENKGTNAGTYNATVLIKKDNYNDLTLKAKLTINKIALPSITFENDSFEYDQSEHAISVTGSIPTGVTVVYSGGENENKATSVGKYTITAVISGINYIQQTLTATLEIKSTEELLSVINYNGSVYFQNALDSNKLYVYNGTAIEKVNNEKPEHFISAASKLYYFSSGLFSSGIASFDGTTSNNLMDTNGEYLATDGTNLYFAINNILKTSVNGIYRVSISDLESANIDPIPTRIAQVKAEYLVYNNGFIYFSNSSEGGKLYRVSATATNSTAELVYNYKVSDIITDGANIYFTRHFTLSNASAGAAIYGINVSSQMSLPLDDDASEITKITYSKGKYLVKANDYIYFVNTDLVTSTIFGDGIYRAPANGSGWVSDTFSLLAGASKVVDGEADNIYSLTTDGTNLYYYRASDKHLYQFDGTTETDMMDGFVPPEVKEIISTYYEKMEEYNGELYYINMRDAGRLYKYSIAQNAEYRITGLQVADFAINGDYIYYATVRLFTNFDLYRMHLVTGEMERLSTDKCMHFAFDDTKLYYANFSGENTLNSMNLDGSEDSVLFADEKVDDYNIIAYNGLVYFVADGIFYVWDISKGEANILNDEAKPNEYTIANGAIYLMNDKVKNYFATLTLNGATLTNILDMGLMDDARSFFVIGNDIYFYRNVAAGSSSKGLYKVDTTASSPAAVLVDDLDYGTEHYYMSSATVIDGKVYFIDVWQIKNSLPTTASTGNLCVLDLATNTITVLAK